MVSHIKTTFYQMMFEQTDCRLIISLIPWHSFEGGSLGENKSSKGSCTQSSKERDKEEEAGNRERAVRAIRSSYGTKLHLLFIFRGIT